MLDALEQGRDGSPQVDHQVGRRQELDQHLVQLAVGAVIALVDQPLAVQVAGEDLGVFVDAAILDGRGGVVEQLAVERAAGG